ncbi:MAG TPA: hypothetical protein VKM55_30865 [Candidatus Lokiarchaeia archaeon]|nr:hypothetical protein [Candidatus Lokiarchaeia archaeon]
MSAFINFYNKGFSLHPDKDDYLRSLYRCYKKSMDEAAACLYKISAMTNPRKKEKLADKARKLLDEASKIEACINGSRKGKART